MNLDNYIPKGQLEGFPKEVIAKMLEEQVKQGNYEDVSCFEENIASANPDGFTWGESLDGGDFWHKVITLKDFDVFFSKYPKATTESKYPKVMMVSCDEESWVKRVVFMEKNGMFLVWGEVEDLDEAKETISVLWWEFAKDIEEAQPPIHKSAEEKKLEEISAGIKKFSEDLETLNNSFNNLLKEWGITVKNNVKL